MIITLIISILFYGGAIYNLTQKDVNNAIFGAVLGTVLMIFYLVYRNNSNKNKVFLIWLVKNKEDIKKGNAVKFEDLNIDLNTELTQFQLCYSFIIFTSKFPSRYYINYQENTFLPNTVFTILTILLGWWGIPWGPIYTVQTIIRNIKGGVKTNIKDLITQMDEIK